LLDSLQTKNKESGLRAVVFTGQGSQFPGMGRDFFDGSPKARGRFQQINELLGFPITDMMFDGPREELARTVNAQLAIVAFEAAVLSSLPNLNPGMFARHSVGEYTAVFAAGGYLEGLKTLFKLVRARANAMQEACDTQPGTMAAVLGLDSIQVMTICSAVSKEYGCTVVSASFNTPTQTVISGDLVGVRKVRERCRVLGAKVIPRSVSGAFHSPLMLPAVEKLREILMQPGFCVTRGQVYLNHTSLPTNDPHEIRLALLEQTNHPVLWHTTIDHMIEDGAREFVEISPMPILSPMIRAINPNVRVRSITTWKEAQAFNQGS